MRIPVPAPFHPSGAMVVPPDRTVGSPTFWGQNFNDDVKVDLAPQCAPNPIRYSQYSEVGRPATLAWADVPVALHMNIGGIQSVQEDFFLTGKVRPDWNAFLKSGGGGQLAFLPDKTIDPGTSAPFGNRATVSGTGSSQYPGNVTAHGLTFNVGDGY